MDTREWGSTHQFSNQTHKAMQAQEAPDLCQQVYPAESLKALCSCTDDSGL
jgi:hypothetical protein